MASAIRSCLIFLMLGAAIGRSFGQEAGEWCPVQTCETCDVIVTSANRSNTFIIGEGQTVCFNGSFTFNGTLRAASTAVTMKICIPETSSITMTNFLRFDGGFELKNHGTLTLTRASTIRPGQAVYNYGAFSIPPDAALTIRAGGLFCNTSSAYIGGDILNYGTLKSSGYLESGNEFKNFPGAETWITQLIVKDEITNDGSLYLQGSIESLNKSFKNTGTVIGMEGPCNSIKASGNIINTGLLDGTDGVIAIVKEENQFNDSGSREGDVVFKDSDDLSEDCNGEPKRSGKIGTLILNGWEKVPRYLKKLVRCRG
jgi:hypothetical protein